MEYLVNPTKYDSPDRLCIGRCDCKGEWGSCIHKTCDHESCTTYMICPCRTSCIGPGRQPLNKY